MNEELASMLVGALVVMIPIIAILTNHQRKMAELIHGRANQHEGNQARSQDLMIHEMMRLREQVTTQALQIEELREQINRPQSIAAPTAEALNPTEWDTERLR